MARARLPEGQFRAVPAQAPGKVDCNPGHCPQQVKIADMLTLWGVGDLRQADSTERKACLGPTMTFRIKLRDRPHHPET